MPRRTSIIPFQYLSRCLASEEKVISSNAVTGNQAAHSVIENSGLQDLRRATRQEPLLRWFSMPVAP